MKEECKESKGKRIKPDKKILKKSSDSIDKNLEKIDILEEIITDEEAIRFYNLLSNPPKDVERQRMIIEALQLFPDPKKPTKVNIDL